MKHIVESQTYFVIKKVQLEEVKKFEKAVVQVLTLMNFMS